MKQRPAKQHSPESRLNAVLTLIASHTTRDLAKQVLRVDPTVLAHVRVGRVNLNERLARRLEEAVGVSSAWLLNGRGDVFVRGRSAGQNVADAITRQIEYGPAQTHAVPVIHDVSMANPSADDERRCAGEKVSWLTTARRSLSPTLSEREHGFYLVLTKETAPLAGGQPGDYVLFIPMKEYARSLPPFGERTLCIARRDGELQLYSRVWMVSELTLSAKSAKQEDVLFGGGLRFLPDYKIKSGRTVTVVFGPDDAIRANDILAVAVRLERPMLPFSEPPRSKPEDADPERANNLSGGAVGEG